MPRKLLVMMVDGISAEHYDSVVQHLPHFRQLQERGFRVKHLKSETIAVSLPGRTSILTGVTADHSGIYANHIWDRDTFRYATPDDVRVQTLPALARAAGLKVANIGMGMVRPEDADIFIPPWWAGEMIQRGRDAQPQPAGDGWLRAIQQPLPDAFISLCEQAGITSVVPELSEFPEEYQKFYSIFADHLMADWVGMLAISEQSPDLILTEFLTPDSFQHDTGYRSALSDWALEQADVALGEIVLRLQESNVLDQWDIVVLSDHGHSPIEQAIFPQRLLPETKMLCEGSCLLIVPRNEVELQTAIARLAEFGVEPYAATCFPADLQEQIVLFVAPDGVAFEDARSDTDGVVGSPAMISSHGLRPGSPKDDRFALFAGPSIPQGCLETAEAVQIAPTLAKVLGLPVNHFPASPIFKTHPEV